MKVNLNQVNSIIFFLMMSMSFSCSKRAREYSYGFWQEKDSVPSSYILRKVQYEKDHRTDLIFSSKDMKGPFKQVNKEKYVARKDGLDRLITKGDSIIKKPYLTIANDNCIEFLFDNGMDDVLATTLCFLGQENIFIGNKEYKDVYKFKKRQGMLDGVESIAYYDTDFILLKEEFASGYADEYRIVRLDTLPRL
ncbi:MAG: hypothetical protein HC819_22295 [Cyclobacteriaceae bacterium]|nr:hypothetical protein [Cyclobacteriaceae bacterium]